MNIRFLFTSALVAIGMAATAQIPVATPMELPQGSHHPVISPDGKTLLFSTDVHTGLSALSLENGNICKLDDAAAAGFQPVFSTDSKTVFYRTAQTIDGLLYRDVRSYNLVENSGKKLAAPSRDNVNLSQIAGGDFAVADYLTIKVSKNGKTANISPLAESHSYLWASLSKDGSRLLFTEPFSGVYVANADGSNPVNVLPKGDFASWAGENAIIAVVSHDDGYVILDSTLMLVNLATGISTPLTPEGFLVSEATASPTGMVVFTDIEGNMYKLNLNDIKF